MSQDIVTAMLLAVKAAEALGSPMREKRMHPEDIAALRGALLPYPLPANNSFAGARFAGVDLIPDERAPRLPRKGA